MSNTTPPPVDPARAKLLKRLDEAEAAYHDLTIGDMAKVTVDSNGERVEFQSANSAKLAGYIRALRIELGLVTNIGPAGFWMR